ncbi:tryptophan synthase subunit beta, partial [bacterium]|nr:tryptophan synthase subunit beta [bacterium]
GLDYPSIGPEHAHLRDVGRVDYTAVSDQEALEAFKILSELEGIIPALESSHAVAYCMKTKELTSMLGSDPSDLRVIINLSGRGDKDVEIIRDLRQK